MKWINAEQQVTTEVYDKEHEEFLDKIMTVEEMLDTYTNEGCPAIYSNPEPKRGHWKVWYQGDTIFSYTCNLCGSHSPNEKTPYCAYCGAKMEKQ